MPYMREGKCVHKANADGSAGEEIKCHETVEDAEKHLAALAINVKEFGGSLDDQVQAARTAFERQYPSNGMGLDTPWVSDVFNDHVIVRRGMNYFQVGYKQVEDTLTFDPPDQWQRVRLDYVSEMGSDDDVVVELVTVSEFKGDYPEVPFAPGITIDALTHDDQGQLVDPNPFFLTLPVAKVGNVSSNGLEHDQDFAQSLVKQINEKRPGGNMGHLKDEDRDTEFKVNDVQWVGAALVDGTIWSKGYIPVTRPEVREDFRVKKAVNAKVATSVYGLAHKEMQGLSRTWRARPFNLEKLDLAPYERAASPGSGVFFVTREMASDKPSVEAKKEVDMSVNLTLADVPDALRAQIIKEYEAQSEQGRVVKELTATNTTLETKVAELTKDKTTLETKVAELEQHIADTEAARELEQFGLAVRGRVVGEFLDWDSGDDKVVAARDALRKQFELRVLAEIGTERDPDKVKAIFTTVWDNDFKVLAETMRDNFSGPAAAIGRRLNRRETPAVDASPEAMAAARAKFGF